MEKITAVERYLKGMMSPEERGVFFKKMKTDDKFRKDCVLYALLIKMIRDQGRKDNQPP